MDDDAELLEIFDKQIRRVPESIPGFAIELLTEPAPFLRITPTGADAGWGGGVVWSDLNESNADAAIAAVLEWFRPRGREFEWKHYGYDRPIDLPKRLANVGFAPDPEEALVIGDVDGVLQRLARTSDPEGITIRRLQHDAPGAAADWDGINAMHESVWGEDGSEMNAAIATAIAADPQRTSMWLAKTDEGTIVAAARANFHAGTDFVSLWGGSTLEAYRGRGIYSALVLRRAQEAAQRGFRFLQVDALPASRRILEPLGLRFLTSTTPWMWRPQPALDT